MDTCGGREDWYQDTVSNDPEVVRIEDLTAEWLIEEISFDVLEEIAAYVEDKRRKMKYNYNT